jgi:hypothetical protein
MPGRGPAHGRKRCGSSRTRSDDGLPADPADMTPGVSSLRLLDHPFDHPDDPTGPICIGPDRRGLQPEQARSVWIRPDRRRAPGYGSGGWGLESLAERTSWNARPRASQISSSEGVYESPADDSACPVDHPSRANLALRTPVRYLGRRPWQAAPTLRLFQCRVRLGLSVWPCRRRHHNSPFAR